VKVGSLRRQGEDEIGAMEGVLRGAAGLAPKVRREIGQLQRPQLTPRQVPLSSRQATPFKIADEPARLMVWV
jgi:hypothetical protein